MAKFNVDEYFFVYRVNNLHTIDGFDWNELSMLSASWV